MWISGTGLEADYERATKNKKSLGKKSSRVPNPAKPAAIACLERYERSA